MMAHYAQKLTYYNVHVCYAPMLQESHYDAFLRIHFTRPTAAHIYDYLADHYNGEVSLSPPSSPTLAEILVLNT